jgi:hypothetical protein
VLHLVESTVPIANMLQEPVKTLNGVVTAASQEELTDLADLAAHAEQFLIRSGSTPKSAREKTLSSEPFVRYRNALLEILG